MAEQIEFDIIGDHPDPIISGEPIAIYRFVSEAANWAGRQLTVFVDLELESPDVDDFFIVWARTNEPHKYICEYHGRFVIAWQLRPVGFGKVSIPLIKKAYPKLIASAIVGVQPMSAPASLVYYMQYQYAKTRQPLPDDK